MKWRLLVGLLMVGIFSAETARAQSAIAGTVTDASGAIVPGVTVEARSPALIEQVRSVVTNADGRYSIVDLRPGTYSVTFTLAGFSTFVRDGIELQTQFTATVDAQLRVGAVEETLTVSGQSPVVDVQSTVRRDVVSQEQLQTLPTGRSLQAMATMLPAVVNSGGGGVDVGGSAQMQQGNITAYGSLTADMAFEIDGMNIMSMFGTGSTPGFYQNMGAYEEISYQVVAGSATSQDVSDLSPYRRLVGMPPAMRRMALDLPTRTSEPPYHSLIPQDLLVQVFGDAAVTTFHIERDGILRRRTIVFVNRDENWRIVHLHASSVQMDGSI